jgi:Family of unknown function (DUF5715)
MKISSLLLALWTTLSVASAWAKELTKKEIYRILQWENNEEVAYLEKKGYKPFLSTETIQKNKNLVRVPENGIWFSLSQQLGESTQDNSLKESLKYVHPSVKKYIETLGKDFYKKFKWAFEITSLNRSMEYQRILQNNNMNATKISTHTLWLAFDITKKGLAQNEISWLQRRLAQDEQQGITFATEEKYASLCFHVVLKEAH